MNNGLYLAFAREYDFEKYHELKSEVNNIFWSGFTFPPIKENLQSYYLKALRGISRDIFIVWQKDQAVGYLYLDYLDEEASVEFSYGISEKFSGHGFAKEVIAIALAELEPKYSTQFAWVAENNIASIKSILSNDFVITNEIEYKTLEQEPDKVKFIKFIR
jgi:RimJ/RimL family protein N-acetyltransferase